MKLMNLHGFPLYGRGLHKWVGDFWLTKGFHLDNNIFLFSNRCLIVNHSLQCQMCCFPIKCKRDTKVSIQSPSRKLTIIIIMQNNQVLIRIYKHPMLLQYKMFLKVKWIIKRSDISIEKINLNNLYWDLKPNRIDTYQLVT